MTLNEWPMPNDHQAPDAVDEAEQAGGERFGAAETPTGEPHSRIVAPMPRPDEEPDPEPVAAMREGSLS